MNRFNYNSTATVERSVVDSLNSDKSSYALVSGVSYRGYFSPVTQTNGVDAVSVIDQQYQFITSYSADIKQSDKLIIDAVKYGVKGVVKYKNLGQRLTAVTLFLNTRP